MALEHDIAESIKFLLQHVHLCQHRRDLVVLLFQPLEQLLDESVLVVGSLARFLFVVCLFSVSWTFLFVVRVSGLSMGCMTTSAVFGFCSTGIFTFWYELRSSMLLLAAAASSSSW